jgi:subtilisin family serine protease
MKRSLQRWVALALTISLVACGGAPSGGMSTPDATTLTLEPQALAFLGTSSHTITITANGTWTATAAQPWLTITPRSGTGNATVTVTVNRNGLTPDHYAGTILLRGAASAREAVTVYMRFPTLYGSLTNPTNHITTTSASDPFILPHSPNELLVTLNPHVVALHTLEPHERSTLHPSDALARLTPSDLRAAAHALAQRHGLHDPRPIAPGNTTYVMHTTNPRAALAALEGDGRTLEAHPNYRFSSTRVPNDPLYGLQAWHYEMISLPSGAWDVTTGSHEVVAAVIDSPINVQHVDLVGRTVSGYDFHRGAVATPRGAYEAHGTHVAGTVAARGNNLTGVSGVAWDARIMPLNVFAPEGWATLENIMRAVMFAAGSCVQDSFGTTVCPVGRADVVNLSLGVENPSCVEMPKIASFEEVFAFALGSGVSIVAAAGNDGCASVVSLPASIPGVLAVAALASDGLRASYSNRGNELFIAAPGGNEFVGVVSLGVEDGQYAPAAGTSMASPHVAGVIALMKAANPDLTPGAIMLILARTAQDLGAAGFDTSYGFGLLRADRAVSEARSLLQGSYDGMLVRIRSGDSVVATTRADLGGSFALPNLPSGVYTLEAGNDQRNDGRLGDPGEFYGATTLTISYSGDSSIELAVVPR